MPIPITPKPQYPDVPRYPGVPPVPRQPGVVAAQNNIVLATADAFQVLNLFLEPQWGLFTEDGAPAFSTLPGLSGLGQFARVAGTALQILGAGGQSVAEVEFRNDNRISTAPQEEGAFLSYNKVDSPFNGRVAYIVGGTEGQRGQFLAAAQQYQHSLELLTLVMPEFVYPSVNVIHHGFRRTARSGISMFVVDVWVEEVRITGTAEFSNTKAPNGASQVNGGTVQPSNPTPAQAASGGLGPSGFGQG